MGVSFTDALHTYTLLTIGDGLVSQIPALIVSTAAGLLVSKAGVTGRADMALFGQLGALPEGARRHLGPARHAGDPAGPADRPLPAALGGCRRPRLPRDGAAQGGGRGQGRGEQAGAARRGADRDRARHRHDPARARLRALGPDQRRPRPAPDRPDQGAAPPARGRDGLRHAVGPHPGQHPAPGQHLRDPDQGGRGRARRHPADHAAGHGPAGQADLAAGRGHGRADLRPAGDVGGTRAARGGDASAAARSSIRRPSSRRT